MEGNFSWRHALAFLVTITSAWVIWRGTHLVLTEPDHFAHTPLMHVSLQAPPTPPAPPKVQPKPPKPIVQKQVASRTPLETSPHAIGPPVTNNAPVTSQNATPTPPSPPAPAGPTENMTLEFDLSRERGLGHQPAEALSAVEGCAIATTQRHGRRVADLGSAGQPAGCRHRAIGGSLLDRAALESVHRATFAPIRDDLWPGESKVRFTANQYFHPQ